MVLLRWLSSQFQISKETFKVHQKDTLDLAIHSIAVWRLYMTEDAWDQEPVTWSLHLPYKPLESTLSDEKLFIEIAFAEYFSRLLSNIQSEQSYDHTSHADSQKRDLNCCQQWR